MKISVACRLALVQGAVLFPAMAYAAPQLPPDTLSVYDERDYAWPGAPADGKPLIEEITVAPGYGESPLRPFGDCVYTDNQGDAFSLSFKTKEEWEKFKKNHPASVSLHACCPHEVAENPCQSDKKKILGAGRVGAFATFGFSPSYVHVYQCAAVSDSLAEWKLVGESTAGGCPPPDVDFMMIHAKSCASFLQDSSDESFPDGTSIIVPTANCNRNYVCMNGDWQQTNWWTGADAVRHTGASECY